MRSDLGHGGTPSTGNGGWVAAATLAILTVSWVGGAAAPAGADPARDDPAPAHIDRSLADVAVSSPAYDAAVGELAATRAALADTEARLSDGQRRVIRLAADQDRLQTHIARDTATRDDAEAEMAVLSDRMRGLALQAYVGATDDAAAHATYGLDDQAFLQARSSVTLRDAVLDTTNTAYERHRRIAEAAEGRLTRDTATLADTVAELQATRAEVQAAQRARENQQVEVFRALARVQDTRATALVQGTDLPLVVLDAYLAAARAANARTPGCHLHWSLLAGIGRIESGQGTHGGAVVRRDGTLTRPIYGIPLNGDHDTQVIRTADGSFMRAEGPMQFLPSTWAAVAVDGDGDGVTDIQNLYDAAATAGAYLCGDGADLNVESSRRRAILRYNFSGAYVAEVTREMRRYADAVPELPAG